MKKRLKFRAISLFLILTILAAYGVPAYARSDKSDTDDTLEIFDESYEIDEPILLDTVYPEDEPYMISIATQESSLDEGGKYIVTIVRSGDAEDEASVAVETIDMSAAYGEDYRIIYDDFETEVYETEGTMIEQATDYDTQAERLASLEESLAEENVAEKEAAENIDEDEIVDEEASEVFGASDNTDEAEVIDYADDADLYGNESSGKSSLALLKEAQTGKETRETYNTEYTSIDETLLESVQQFQALTELTSEAAYLAASSSTVITFEPGETEKTFVVETIDDDESEGDEMFKLCLAYPTNGYLLGSYSTCSFTILDGDPLVLSKLSFSDAVYSGSGSTVEVTVTRSEALYSMCTTMIRSVDIGSAIEGVDHSKVEAELAFEPYREEFTFEIPIQYNGDDKSFAIELYDMVGAEEGDITYATVNITAMASAAQSDDETAYLAEATATPIAEDQSFTITLDQKYTVRYYKGETVGTIYDTSYSPEIEVGKYFFVPTSGSNYGRDGNECSSAIHTITYTFQDAEPNGRAFLEWYCATLALNGSSYVTMNGTQNGLLNTSPYQYLAVEWEQIENSQHAYSYIDLISPIANNTLETYPVEFTVSGKFGKSVSTYIPLVDKNYVPTKEFLDLKIGARDKESSHAPDVRTYVYGVAAIYKKFVVKVDDPDTMPFLQANGSYSNELPARPSLAGGSVSNYRYYGQTIQINNEPADDGLIKGEITGYDITVDTGNGTGTIKNYQPTGNNIECLPIDDNLMEEIYKVLPGAVTLESDNTYTINLNVKPIYKYIDVEVEILESNKGTFTDMTDGTDVTTLNSGTYTFHKGDTLYLDGTPSDSSYYYSGYHIIEYKNAGDTLGSESDVYYPPERQLTSRKYVLSPNFTDYQNCVSIEVLDNAQGKVTILNTVPEDQLPNQLKIDNTYILNTSDSDSEYSYEARLGEVYTVEAVVIATAPTGYVYRPVFKVSSSNIKVKGNYFDFAASGNPSYNEVTVDVELVAENTIKHFDLTGYTTVSGDGIRESSSTTGTSAVGGVTLRAGGIQVEDYDKGTDITPIIPCTAISNTGSSEYDGENDGSSAEDGGDSDDSSDDSDKGAFTISGVPGADGDTISILTETSDGIKGVQYVTLNTRGASTGNVDYTVYRYNTSAKAIAYTRKNVSGYIVDCGEINLPIVSGDAPYVTEITYTSDNNTIDTADNSIPILNATLNVTATVHLNGHQLKEVIFTRVPNVGDPEKFEVDADSGVENQISFTCEFNNMSTTFKGGDMLYVTLVDEEDRIITYYDASGVEREEKQDKKYMQVFTGLSFYEEYVIPNPQTVEVVSDVSVSVPTLNNVQPSVSSGTLSFERISDGDDAYYYQYTLAIGTSSDKSQTSLVNQMLGVGSQASSAAGNAEADAQADRGTWKKLAGYAGNAATYTYGKDNDKKPVLGGSQVGISEGFTYGGQIMVIYCVYFVRSTEENNDGTVTSVFKNAFSECILGFDIGDFGLNKVFNLGPIPCYAGFNFDLDMVFVMLYNRGSFTNTEFENRSNVATVSHKYLSYVLPSIDLVVYVGAGVYQLLGVRGELTFNFVARGKIEQDELPTSTPAALTADLTESDATATPMPTSFPNGWWVELQGGFGVDAFIISGDYTWPLHDWTSGVYAGDVGYTVSLDSTDDYEGGMLNVRTIGSGTSDMSTFALNETAGSPELGAMTSEYAVLLDDAAERTRPQLVTFENGKKALFFIGSADEEDTMNSQRLYYTICDTDGIWQTPKLVDYDDTVDTKPDVSVSGNKCVVAWSDANHALASETESVDALASLEISYAVLDADSETITEPMTLTDDSYMDVVLSFECDENGILYCYYMKQDIAEAETDEELFDANATYSTVAYREYDSDTNEWGEEIYVDIECDGITDPLISDFDSINTSHNGNKYSISTYTIDQDEDVTTTEDRDLYVKIDDLTNDISYYPIRISDNGVTESMPSLTRFNGDIYLSWIQDDAKFCMIDLSSCVGAIEQFADEDGNVVNYMDTFLSKDPTSPDWYKFTADELGMDEDDYSGSIFEKLYNGSFYPVVKDFTYSDGSAELISDYRLYNNNDEALYMLWTDCVADEDDNTKEVFASVLEVVDSEEGDDSANRYSGWSDLVQVTDFDKTIDEVSAAFDNDGNLYFCSNLFNQVVNDDGTLDCSDNDLIIFRTACVPKLEQEDELELDNIPRSGETTNVSFSFKNNGLESSEGFTVTMSEVQNGTETVVYSKTVESQLVVGKEIPISINWTAPESLDDLQLKIEVDEINGYGSPIMITKDIEQYSQIYADGEVNLVGQDLYLTVELENAGNVDAEDISIVANEYDEDGDGIVKEFSTLEGVSVPAGETTEVTILLEELDYTDIDEYLTCYVQYNVNYREETISGTMPLLVNDALDIVIGCDENVELAVDEKLSVDAMVVPTSLSDTRVKYYTSDASIANVNNDGVITACSSGTAIVTAYNPSSFLKTEITVTVIGDDEATPTPTAKTYPSSSSSGASTSFSTGASATAIPSASEEPSATSEPGSETESVLPFMDVSTSDWFYDDVLSVYTSGLMNGVSEDMFEPNTDVTRGMFVTTLGRAAGIDTSGYSGTAFNDVDPSEYYAPYIAWAAENAIVDGYGDDLFGPDDPVTREQAAKIIMNYETYLGNGPEGVWAIRLDYSDINLMDDWAVEGIMYCTMNNIMQGNDDGTFSPLNNILRCECAAVLSRLTETETISETENDTE